MSGSIKILFGISSRISIGKKSKNLKSNRIDASETEKRADAAVKQEDVAKRGAKRQGEPRGARRHRKRPLSLDLAATSSRHWNHRKEEVKTVNLRLWGIRGSGSGENEG